MIEISRLLSTWNEDTTIHADRPGVSGPKQRISIQQCDQPGIPGRSPGWRSIDVTYLVAKWYDGSLEEHGFEIAARSEGADVLIAFASKEYAPPPNEKAPRLLVRLGPSATPPPVPTRAP